MVIACITPLIGVHVLQVRRHSVCCNIMIRLWTRVPTPPGKSWKVLDFFPKNSRTWKVLENHFGPGKSWKLKFNVLEKYPWKLCVNDVSRISSTKFGRFILSKIVKIVATRCHILRLKYTKFSFGWGAPDRALGAHSAPLDHLAGFKGSYFEGKVREDRGQKQSEGFFLYI